jgi:hypothetical protein
MIIELNLPSRCERILLVNQMVVIAIRGNWLYCSRWRILRNGNTDSVSYGHRWTAETVFFAIKRMFGEYVMARKYPNMVKEIFWKYRCRICSRI